MGSNSGQHIIHAWSSLTGRAVEQVGPEGDSRPHNGLILAHLERFGNCHQATTSPERIASEVWWGGVGLGGMINQHPPPLVCHSIEDIVSSVYRHPLPHGRRKLGPGTKST